MKKQQMAKLQEFKEVSAQLIQQMQSIINKNADKKKAYDKRKKDEALERVKALLARAAAKGNKEILWMLINQGVNINTRDIDGFTPMELAAQKEHTAVVQLLQGMGAQPGNPEILAKELREKQAVLWYLGGHGWAVKTKNHFLIFDYHPLPFQLKRVPRVPLLANGQVNPSELKNQRVFVFFSQQVLEGYSCLSSLFLFFLKYLYPILTLTKNFYIISWL